MRGVIAILLAFITVHFYGQNLQNDVRYYDDEKQATIHFSGFGHFGSTALDLHTSKLFYQGGFFSDALKQESLNRLRDVNVFGGEYNFKLDYNNPVSNLFDDAGFYATIETGGTAGISFSEDLFKVIFQGNRSFVGDTARLAPLEIANYQYRKIGFGLNQDDRIKFGVSALVFDTWQKAKLDVGNLAIDENLDSISFAMDGRFRNAANLNVPAGVGLGVDFEVVFPLGGKADTLDKTKLVAGIKNFGLFFSNKSMLTYELDTTYSFSGFNISSISEFQSSIIGTDQLQDSLVPKAVANRIVDLMPFEIYFYSTSRADGKKLQLVYGFRYRYAAASMPQVYVGGDWRPNPKTIFSNYLHFGGYAMIQWGVSIKKAIGNFKIGLSSNNLHGFFTKEAYSQSLGLTMSYVIK
jgi:hypothetical protein